MAVFGVGTDIVSLRRIERIYARHGEAFEKRILSPLEQQELGDQVGRAAFLGRRFAAKEAFAKALGTGIGSQACFTEVTIAHEGQGRPILRLSGTTRATAERARITASHLSLADEVEYAVAYVLLVCEP